MVCEVLAKYSYYVDAAHHHYLCYDQERCPYLRYM